MSVALVSPKTGLVEAVAARLKPEGKDYSRHLVVFPERRPAYYLRKALAAREGSGFLPPRTASIESFVDQVYGERMGRRDRAIDALDAAALLFEIHRSAPDRLGAEHFLTADQFFPLGTKLFRDLEELAAADVTKDGLLKLDFWADESIPEATRKRLQSLSFFHERFYDALEARGFSTPASRLRAVAAEVRPELFADTDRMIFAGFFTLARVEGLLIRKMLEWDGFELLLLEGKGIGAALDGLGIADPALRARALEAELEGGAEGLEKIEIIESPDTHGQVFALNEALAPFLADPARLNENAVVVLPAAETLFPLYEQTLSGLAPDAFNISLGYPLARTPIYSFFDKLLELVQSMDEEGRVYAPYYLRFVLHPYTKNIFQGQPGRLRESRAGEGARAPEKPPAGPASPNFTRILFHAIEGELIEHRTRAFWGLEELESDPGVMRAVQELTRTVEGAPDVAALMDHLRSIHAALIAPFARILGVADFADKLIAALDFIYENSTARTHYFFHPYAEAFLSRLGSLGRSLLGSLVFEEKGSYFNLFRKVIAAGTVPFEGTPLHGLQILGFWETRGLPFSDVFILDLNEDVLPAFQRTDSLLPFGARKGLGLPTYEDNERRMEYYLNTLVRGAGRVRMFFVENNDKERSRFVQKAIWAKQKAAGEKRSGKFVRTVRYEVALRAARPAAAAKSAEVAEFLNGFTYSATALDTYLKCPLQFYHSYVLGLKEKEEVGEALEKKDIGIFVHSILEEYFGKFAGRAVRPGDLKRTAMDALVERRFRESFGADLSGGLYLMRLQTRRHLREFLTDYQIRLIEDLEAQGKMLKILGLEKKVGTVLEVSPAAGPGAARPFRLTAKIDRTELRGGDFYVLDYKTSANSKYLSVDFKALDAGDRDSWTKAVSSVQLPLYNLILSGRDQMDLPPEKVHCLFVMLGRNRLSPRIEFSAYAGDKATRDLARVIDDPAASPAEKDAARASLELEVRRRISLMREIIGRLLLEIADPAVPFDPARRREGACRFCPFGAICGS